MMARACRLIELLMVVAIIMLPVAVIMPSLGSAEELAMKVIPANNIRERGIAEISYASEGRAFLPWRRTIGCGVSHYDGPCGMEQRLLFLCLRKNKEAFRCPVFKNLVSRTASFSYGMSWNLGVHAGEAGKFDCGEAQSLQHVRDPSRMAVFCEANTWTKSPYSPYGLTDGQMLAEVRPYRDSSGTFHRPQRSRYSKGSTYGYVGTYDEDLNRSIPRGMHRRAASRIRCPLNL